MNINKIKPKTKITPILKYSSKDLYFTIITFLYSFLIIFIGYHILNIAGNYFFSVDSKIDTSNITENNSYIFFSQANNNIALFPWNYYNESLPLNNVSNETNNDSPINNNFISVLYESLNITFNEVIPTELSVYLHNNNETLYNIVDFDHITNNLLTYTDSDAQQYFFYNENKTIKNNTYNISFAFDKNSNIYSFKFKKIYADTVITEDIISNGYTFLNQLITNGNVDSAIFAIPKKAFNPTSNPNGSYQIIESNGEFLLVSTKELVVYYYDPVENKFTGFNHIF